MSEADHLSTFAVDQLAAGLMPAAAAESASRHLAECTRCREALADAKALHARFADEHLEPSLPEVVARATRRRRLRWALPLTLVPALGLALVLALPTRRHEPDLLTKGGNPVLRVIAERSGEVFDVREGQPLREGDRVRFSFDPEGQSYVLVASVDGAGQVSVYVPFGGSESLAIQGDRPFLSPDAVRLDAAPGPERIFALFSQVPLSAETVREQLAALGHRGPEAIRAQRRLPLPANRQLSFFWEKVAP